MNTNKEQTLDLIESGRVEHFAFIFDRTAAGTTLMDHMTGKPSPFDDILHSAAVQFWQTNLMEYLVIWASFGSSPGKVIYALNLDSLLTSALPEIKALTEHSGGLCTHVLGVAEHVQHRIQHKIAELQPHAGSMQ